MASLLPALALVAVTGSALAGERRIYKSIDQDGIVTYSELPPRSTSESPVETLQIDPIGPPGGSTRAATLPKSPEPVTRPDASASAPSTAVPRRPRDGAVADPPRSGSAGGQAPQTRSESRVSGPAEGVAAPERGRAAGTASSTRTSR